MVLLVVIFIGGMLLIGGAFFLWRRWQHVQVYQKAAEALHKEEEYVRLRIDKSADEASVIVHALGGVRNIRTISQCAIRIRVELDDPQKVDETALKQAGVTGVVRTGTAWQLIIGDRAILIAACIEKQCAAARSDK